MSKWHGDRAKGTVIYMEFNTFGVNRQSIDPTTGSAVVYKDNSVSESSLGITLVLAHDGRTGVHQIEIDTSEAFYTEGSDYNVRFVGATIDGISGINANVGRYRR
jgi:hypothetical protein